MRTAIFTGLWMVGDAICMASGLDGMHVYNAAHALMIAFFVLFCIAMDILSLRKNGRGKSEG